MIKYCVAADSHTDDFPLFATCAADATEHLIVFVLLYLVDLNEKSSSTHYSRLDSYMAITEISVVD